MKMIRRNEICVEVKPQQMCSVWISYRAQLSITRDVDVTKILMTMYFEKTNINQKEKWRLKRERRKKMNEIY